MALPDRVNAYRLELYPGKPDIVMYDCDRHPKEYDETIGRDCYKCGKRCGGTKSYETRADHRAICYNCVNTVSKGLVERHVSNLTESKAPGSWNYGPTNVAEESPFSKQIVQYDCQRQRELYFKFISRPCYKCGEPGTGTKAYETKTDKPVCYSCAYPH